MCVSKELVVEQLPTHDWLYSTSDIQTLYHCNLNTFSEVKIDSVILFRKISPCLIKLCTCSTKLSDKLKSAESMCLLA